MEKKYRVRIVRKDTEFEVEGDKQFVLDMLKRFKTDVPETLGQPEREEEETKARSVVPQKPLSVREFIQTLGLKRHTDRTLAFGYYLERHSGKPEFTPADINNCYYEAKMEASNTSQMIIQNIKRGFMMEAKAKTKGASKRYTLTQSGEEHIDKKLKKKTD